MELKGSQVRQLRQAIQRAYPNAFTPVLAKGNTAGHGIILADPCLLSLEAAEQSGRSPLTPLPIRCKPSGS